MTYEPPPPLMPQQPPVKPRNNVRTIIIVVAVLLVLCCAGTATGGYFLYRGISDTVAPARDTATSYADDLIDQDYAGAYGHLCARVRNLITEAEFEMAMSGESRLKAYQVTGAEIRTDNTGTTATITMDLERISGRKEPEIYNLLQEDGNWRIC
jgi:hypothetical protein